MHLLLCLILAFNDFEANRPVRGFDGSESICNRVAHLAFSAPVIYQDRQMDKSITSGAHDVYVTLDISRPIFSISRAVQQGHTAHFAGDTPGLYFNVNAGNLLTLTCKRTPMVYLQLMSRLRQTPSCLPKLCQKMLIDCLRVKIKGQLKRDLNAKLTK